MVMLIKSVGAWKKILPTVRNCEEVEKAECTNMFIFQVTVVNYLGLQTEYWEMHLMLFFLLPLNNFLGGGKNCLLETCKTKGDKLIKYSVPKPNGKTKKAVRPATAHTIYKQLTANRFIFSYHVDFNVLSSRQMKNTGTDHWSSKGYSFLNAQ